MLVDLLLVLVLLVVAAPGPGRIAVLRGHLASVRAALLPWPHPGLSALLALAIALGWLRVALVSYDASGAGVPAAWEEAR